jgi:hypothetical protein
MIRVPASVANETVESYTFFKRCFFSGGVYYIQWALPRQIGFLIRDITVLSPAWFTAIAGKIPFPKIYIQASADPPLADFAPVPTDTRIIGAGLMQDETYYIEPAPVDNTAGGVSQWATSQPKRVKLTNVFISPGRTIELNLRGSIPLVNGPYEWGPPFADVVVSGYKLMKRQAA